MSFPAVAGLARKYSAAASHERSERRASRTPDSAHRSRSSAERRASSAVAAAARSSGSACPNLRSSGS